MTKTGKSTNKLANKEKPKTVREKKVAKKKSAMIKKLTVKSSEPKSERDKKTETKRNKIETAQVDNGNTKRTRSTTKKAGSFKQKPTKAINAKVVIDLLTENLDIEEGHSDKLQKIFDFNSLNKSEKKAFKILQKKLKSTNLPLSKLKSSTKKRLMDSTISSNEFKVSENNFLDLIKFVKLHLSSNDNFKIKGFQNNKFTIERFISDYKKNVSLDSYNYDVFKESYYQDNANNIGNVLNFLKHPPQKTTILATLGFKGIGKSRFCVELYNQLLSSGFLPGKNYDGVINKNQELSEVSNINKNKLPKLSKKDNSDTKQRSKSVTNHSSKDSNVNLNKYVVPVKISFNDETSIVEEIEEVKTLKPFSYRILYDIIISNADKNELLFKSFVKEMEKLTISIPDLISLLISFRKFISEQIKGDLSILFMVDELAKISHFNKNSFNTVKELAINNMIQLLVTGLDRISLNSSSNKRSYTLAHNQTSSGKDINWIVLNSLEFQDDDSLKKMISKLIESKDSTNCEILRAASLSAGHPRTFITYIKNNVFNLPLTTIQTDFSKDYNDLAGLDNEQESLRIWIQILELSFKHKDKTFKYDNLKDLYSKNLILASITGSDDKTIFKNVRIPLTAFEYFINFATSLSITNEYYQLVKNLSNSFRFLINTIMSVNQDFKSFEQFNSYWIAIKLKFLQLKYKFFYDKESIFIDLVDFEVLNKKHKNHPTIEIKIPTLVRVNSPCFLKNLDDYSNIINIIMVTNNTVGFDSCIDFGELLVKYEFKSTTSDDYAGLEYVGTEKMNVSLSEITYHSNTDLYTNITKSKYQFLNKIYDYKNVHLVIITNATTDGSTDVKEFSYSPTISTLCKNNDSYNYYCKEKDRNKQSKDTRFQKVIYEKSKENLVNSYGSTYINSFYFFSFEILFKQEMEKKIEEKRNKKQEEKEKRNKKQEEKSRK